MAEKAFMTGNEALAEGAIRAGCQCYFGYPITPQNDLTAYMSRNMPARNRVFIQAESELAAINMVYGASSAGIRAMTSSSSPGISLKQEGLSYMAAANLPAVVANVQRGGPGLGGIEPSQGDYFQAVKGGGHGDYHLVVLAPLSVQEMHDMAVLAFDLADRYRNPVMILADGLLGQMLEPVELHDESKNRIPDKPWALSGARGRAANIVRSLFVHEGELERTNLALQEKYRAIAAAETRFETYRAEDALVLIAAWGSVARTARGAVDRARAQGVRAGLFRPITLWPWPSAALAAQFPRVRGVAVVEMNAGQMLEDVRLAVNGRAPVTFRGFLGSRIPTETEILAELLELNGKMQ